MITIRNDGTINPFGLFLLRNSRFQLLAPTRDKRDESDEFDGEVNFGTELSSSDWSLNCATSEGLTREEKETKRAELAKLFNNLQEGDWLTYENDPSKMIFVRLSGRVEMTEYSSWLQIAIPLKVDPLWVSVNENVSSGGTIINAGSFPTPVIIEIGGMVINPEVTINNEILRYNGTVGATDLLVIDTDKQTVTFNGINALASFDGSFPKLPTGESTISVPTNTVIRWRNRWI